MALRSDLDTFEVMKIYITFLVCGVSFSSAAKAHDCTPLFIDPHDRLERALDRVFARGDRSRSDEVLSRLDRNLHAWASTKLKALSPDQREVVLSALESSRPGYEFHSPRRPYLGPNEGRITWNDVVPSVILDGPQRRSELAREVLVHEMEHLFRDVAARKGSSESPPRRFEVYRDEIYAFRQSYRWWRRNYGFEDLPRLRALVEDYVDAWVDAVRAELIADTDPRAELRVKTSSRRLGDVRTFLRLRHARANFFVYEVLRLVLTHTEPEFVKLFVEEYRDDQYRDSLEGHSVGRYWSRVLDHRDLLQDWVRQMRR